MQHSNVTDETTLTCNHLLLNSNTVKWTTPLQKNNNNNLDTRFKIGSVWLHVALKSAPDEKL